MNSKITWPWLTWLVLLICIAGFSQSPPPLPISTNQQVTVTNYPVLGTIPNPPEITYTPEVRTNEIFSTLNSMGINFGRQNCVYPQTNHYVTHFQVVSNHLFKIIFDGTTNPLVRQVAVLRKFRTEGVEILELKKTEKTKEIEE